MADTGRQSFTDKAGAALKPDFEKSTTEHVGDKFKGTTDNAASAFQPNSEKSTTQQMGDSASSNTTNASLFDKAKAAVGMDTKH